MEALEQSVSPEGAPEEPSEYALGEKRGQKRSASKPEKRTRKGLFVIDREAWRKVCTVPTERRLNLMTAYLVMLCGTGMDHTSTKWSVKSMMRYTGMRASSGVRAIAELIDCGLVDLAPDHTPTKPRYRIIRPPERSPSIFVPNSFVTGLAHSGSEMLRSIRNMRDSLTLRLMVDLYGETELDAAFAVKPQTVRGVYKPPGSDAEPWAKELRKLGVHKVWQVKAPKEYVWSSEFQHRYGDRDGDATSRLASLQNIRAVKADYWLCTDSTDDADLIFPLSDRMLRATQLASEALLTANKSTAWDSYLSRSGNFLNVAFPAHHKWPAIQLRIRPTIEADTEGRDAAYAERKRIEAHYEAQYERLAGELDNGNFSNPIRTKIETMSKA